MTKQDFQLYLIDVNAIFIEEHYDGLDLYKTYQLNGKGIGYSVGDYEVRLFRTLEHQAVETWSFMGLSGYDQLSANKGEIYKTTIWA